MAHLIKTLIWGRSCRDNGASPLEPWTVPGSIRSLEWRRLGLLLVFTLCAITGARPVMGGSVQQPIATPCCYRSET